MTLAFSPDGKRLVAGGVDNRLRNWEISETAAETTNPCSKLDSLIGRSDSEDHLFQGWQTLLTSAGRPDGEFWKSPEIEERLLWRNSPIGRPLSPWR